MLVSDASGAEAETTSAVFGPNITTTKPISSADPKMIKARRRRATRGRGFIGPVDGAELSIEKLTSQPTIAWRPCL